MKLRQRCCFCFRKSQTDESLSASLVHVLNKLTKASRPLPQGVVLPRPGRHQQQRVEDLVVQAGGVAERVVTAAHRVGRGAGGKSGSRLRCWLRCASPNATCRASS